MGIYVCGNMVTRGTSVYVAHSAVAAAVIFSIIKSVWLYAYFFFIAL